MLSINLLIHNYRIVISVLIFIFEINEYLEGNAKNITCSLYRTVAFVKQWKLEDKTENDITQIAKFGFVAWNFLLANKLG